MIASQNIQKNLINFYDNYVPSLKGGQYTVTVSQTLTAGPAPAPNTQSLPSSPQAPVTQTYLVNAPRFSIAPADVNHVFPANNSTGAFNSVMPQIVFNEPSLPWERNLMLRPVQPSIPWMALLIFSDDDLPAPGSQDRHDQQNPTRITTRLLNDILINGTYNKGTVITKGPGAGILAPTDLVLEDNEDPSTTQCNCLDIPIEVFNALAPTLADATLLAHTRQVSLRQKITSAGNSEFFSAVIANRFCVPPLLLSHLDKGAPKPRKNIAHLVSLEGFETWLNISHPPTIKNFNTVRMISLYSWSFNVQSDPAEDFGQLMNNLLSPSSVSGTDLWFKMPPLHTTPVDLDVTGILLDPLTAPQSAAVSAVQEKIITGYVALGYQMQSGDQSFCWYRGPLCPVLVPEFLQSRDSVNPRTPKNISAAKIFDPSTGVFDVSYSVAFQTGRSLALSSKAFSSSLLAWRKKAHQLVDLIQEYMTGPYRVKMMADKLLDGNGNLTAKGTSDLMQLLKIDLVTGAFSNFLATDFYQGLAKNIGVFGGFSATDSQTKILEAPELFPTPSDLNTLMMHPVIIRLLQQVSGIDNIGVIAAPLAPGNKSISIETGGINEAISAGDALIVYHPDGKSSGWITLDDDATINATTISIKAFAAQETFPVGSILYVQDPDDDAKIVVNWLASLSLLKQVPFNNLVANPNLLPKETIRFFYLDFNWIDALMDGALSIGVQSSRDSLFNQLMRDTLQAKVRFVMGGVRDQLSGVAVPGHQPAITNAAGFLLRSANITNYPGLEITAKNYSFDGPASMQPLRLEKLGNDLLLAIYPDIPVELALSQPSEGLVFGLETDISDNGLVLYLRNVPGVQGCTPGNVGTLLESNDHPVTIPLSAIQKANRSSKAVSLPLAMNIAGTNGLAAIIASELPATGSPVVLSPGSLAVQMVCVPQQMLFTVPKLK